jgi:hypothetical protein
LPSRFSDRAGSFRLAPLNDRADLCWRARADRGLREPPLPRSRQPSRTARRRAFDNRLVAARRLNRRPGRCGHRRDRRGYGLAAAIHEASAGALKKNPGLTIVSEKAEGRCRVYRIKRKRNHYSAGASLWRSANLV